MDKVCARTKNIMIPTYAVGRPEKNPIFLEKRVYQGSSGAVYPHPVIEKIDHERSEKEYTAVIIENKYLEITILPELGGRVYRAFDKIRQRDFVYYNQVIKPALVGLTGPWVSGGIEFNWPQHHRPSTFEPVDFSIVENEDGSQTVWVNEVELMTRTKGMAGFTLYPDKAYLEIKGRLFNRTPFPQTFLWWANPAVKVNDHYQSVFPPDVHAVFDHGKRDVSSFPIARGTYYKVNYAPGTDISRYSNIPVPTSFMAVESNYNFVGGYEHDTQAGMLHVADHHFSPGKKQWTWGNGNFGQAWDKNLTDEDGPYIELMCGVYTDNQPDFSWLQPNEEKTFEQYFFPYSQIGAVQNASKEAALSVDIRGTEINVQVYATLKLDQAQLKISSAGVAVHHERIDVSPEQPFSKTIPLESNTSPSGILVELLDANGRLLVDFSGERNMAKEIPLPASPMADPQDVATTELLYLNGLHLEQYRHATYRPEDYYREAIRRDPHDIRNNNALGLWLMRHGRAEEAEPYFITAVRSLTIRNPNPYDGEPLYNLGWCLVMQRRFDEAYDRFYKSAWNDAWQHSAYFQLARIAAIRRDFAQALYLVDKSLVKNWHSHSARHLKAAILRKLGRLREALALLEESLRLDPFNYGCLFELWLNKAADFPSRSQMHSFNNYAEYSLDYAHAGMYDEACALMEGSSFTDNPLFHYYLGWFSWLAGNRQVAEKHFLNASEPAPDYCFPSKQEEMSMLKTAISLHPNNDKAYYYLGNYWFANKNYDEAISNWESAVARNDRFATPHRNLGLAYFNKRQDTGLALRSMEKAFDADRSDARVLMELDQLYKQLNYPIGQRLRVLEENLALVEQRNDLYLERIALYNTLGDYDMAGRLIAEGRFQPWEGGEGKVVAQYAIVHTECARRQLTEGHAARALQHLEALEVYPENLGEGKLPGTRENDVHYWKGVAHEMLGHTSESEKYFRLATSGSSVPEQAIFYNDPQPDKIFYQGKAWQKLGDTPRARQIFEGLIHYGHQHMNDHIRIDYFAVSLPDLLVFDQQLDLKNQIHCHYVAGLGYLGIGNKEHSDHHFNEALRLNVHHQGVRAHLNRIDL